MRFRFIEQHAGTWPVRLMCRVLEVSPSGYYGWRSRPRSARSAANRQLLADVRRVHADHQGRYGSPRVHAALQSGGSLDEPWPGRASDAPSRHSSSRGSAVPAVHDRQPPRPADRPEPSEAGVLRLSPEQGLAGGHHLSADRRRMALPGGRARSRHTQGGRPAAACWPRFLRTWISGLADR